MLAEKRLDSAFEYKKWNNNAGYVDMGLRPKRARGERGYREEVEGDAAGGHCAPHTARVRVCLSILEERGEGEGGFDGAGGEERLQVSSRKRSREMSDRCGGASGCDREEGSLDDGDGSSVDGVPPPGHRADSHADINPEDIPQAFSHFTYWYSGRQKLVCDLQGIYNDSRRLRQGVVHPG